MQTRFQQMLAERDATCRAEGRTEGRTEGRAQGRAEGGANLLLRQVQRRFGPIPGDVEARIRTAPAADLEAWADAVLDARSLEELLENGCAN